MAVAAVASSLGLVALLGQCTHHAQAPRSAEIRSAASNLKPLSARQLYSRTIALPADASASLTRAGQDLVRLLSQATGVSFTLDKAGERGIRLVRSNSPAAPHDLVEKLAGHSREALCAVGGRATGSGDRAALGCASRPGRLGIGTCDPHQVR